jgi:glucose-6-phosphate isomerase
MPSLFEHPHFQSLLDPSFKIDLKSDQVHDPKRVSALNVKAPLWTGWLAHQDYSVEGYKKLHQLAISRHALNWMQAMQNGKPVNAVENEPSSIAALHTALRMNQPREVLPSALEVAALAKKERKRIADFIKSTSFTSLVVLGIGGSQLGPQAIYESLARMHTSHKPLYFAPNLDPEDHSYVASQIDPKTVLIAVISKSGGTLETHLGEKWWRQYLISKGVDPKNHIVSITTPGSRMDRPGDFLDCFYFDPSIGGRYSWSSSIGALTVGFSFGSDCFEKLLEGAYAMDLHALEDERGANLPLSLAFTSIWQRQVMKRQTQAIICYKQGLHRFTAHLQQLIMESLGKGTDRLALPLGAACGPLIWGEPGTCAQHSFFQWLHQGTDDVPVDFILEAKTASKDPLEQEMHRQLLANVLAQSQALCQGKQDSKAHKACPGSRPSTLLYCEELNPQALGALIALYEHRTAFEGFILGLNPFDQEGVELGKHLARDTYDILSQGKSDAAWFQSIVNE